MGAAKALTGGREITEKLIPAVARLAQVDHLNDEDHDEDLDDDRDDDHDDDHDDDQDDYHDDVFSGRKFGGTNLRKDDAETSDGASGL